MEEGTKKNIKKIVLIGPESTGKTKLAKYLAKFYHTVAVPEYARGYIENLDRPYNYNDVEHIARMQVELENKTQEKANRFLFYDTYLIITKVWFDIVYKKVPDWIEQKIKESKIDLFLLCNNDIPWEPDPVRENGGEMREKLFDIYKNELENYKFSYKIVEGEGKTRYKNAINAIENFFTISK
ncbi:MAG: ATP-binding protein [Bacteroidales bacterium]